jgi:hypothetical protein
MSKSRRFQPYPSTNKTRLETLWTGVDECRKRVCERDNRRSRIFCLSPHFFSIVIKYDSPKVLHTTYSSNVDIGIHYYRTTGTYPCIVLLLDYTAITIRQCMQGKPTRDILAVQGIRRGRMTYCYYQGKPTAILASRHLCNLDVFWKNLKIRKKG